MENQKHSRSDDNSGRNSKGDSPSKRSGTSKVKKSPKKSDDKSHMSQQR